ncbi:uncharacterized protein LOC119610166 [Lucilia sericata]|uniref:uncharacterized protein LOC119610166 n=1 Tax=Lucilia sericata TaxID=13632 RepID=UPI0018A829A1|nr:uncharacterized protein LOC119610166 [Lucilia sericata]
MEELLETTLDQLENKPRLMTKYVDDLFGILKKDQVEITLRTLNAFHRRIQFTLEKEIDNRLPYLDSIIIRRGNMIKLDWYQKPMASGRLINFYSKHPKRIIMNTATNFITRIHDNESRITKLRGIIDNRVEEHDCELFMLSEETIYNNVKDDNDKRLIEKFETLRENGTAKLDMKHNKDWFVNRTEKIIPTNIQWLLSLGSKFALPNTRETFPLFKCITDGEQCIQTIEDKEQQEISRAKFVTLIDDHMRKSKMNARDKLILNTVVQCEKYLEANNDIIILNSDKGNKTVAMTKDDYNTKMMDIIKDMCTYRRLKKDPTLSLQNKNNILVEKLYKLNRRKGI